MKNILKAFKGKEFTSIDIGSYYTKIIQCTTQKNRINVTKACYFPTPTSSFKDGQILDVEKMAQGIKEIMAKNSFKLGTPTVCSLESSLIISREIVIPYAKEQEMAEAVEFELEQYMPIDIQKHVVDYKLIEVFEDKGVKKGRVLVAALPTEISRTYFDLINLIGCRPIALDIHSNSLSKFYSFSLMSNKSLKNKTVSIIDLGYEHINIIIIQDGVLKFNRLLNIGSKDIDLSIANAFNYYLKEAEEKKLRLKSLSLPEESEDYNTAENIKGTVNMWLDSIQRIFRYYLSRGSSNNIDLLYLYGGGTSLPGLTEMFKSYFGTETIILSNSDNIVSNTNDLDYIYYINALGAIIGRQG